MRVKSIVKRGIALGFTLGIVLLDTTPVLAAGGNGIVVEKSASYINATNGVSHTEDGTPVIRINDDDDASELTMEVYRSDGTKVEGTTNANGVTTYELESKAKDNAEALEDMAQRLKGTAKFANFDDDKLKAVAWCISNAITTLKAQGYSSSATAGVLVNAEHESYYSPYCLQDMSPTTAYRMFAFGDNITLTLNGENPYTSGSGADADTALSSPDRVTLDLSGISHSASKGVGLIQFTDYVNPDISQHHFWELKQGMRRSNFIYTLGGTTNDAWSAILKTNSYNYWTPTTQQDIDQEVTTVNEEGEVGTEKVTVLANDAPLTTYSSSKIVMPSADTQVIFIDEDDKACWQKPGKNNADLLSSYSIPTEMSYDDYKSYDGTAQQATMAWCVYMEKPASTDTRATQRASFGTDEEVLCGIVNDYYDGALNLDTIKHNGISTSSALAGEDTGSGIYTGHCVQSHNTSLANSGYLSESQCSDILIQTEGTISQDLLDMAQRAYLKQQELNALVDWENEVKVNSFENKLVLFGRRVVIFMGIILMIWSMLIYLAYWFDKFNTVIYIDLLGKITFGRLCAADIAEHSTYSNKREIGHKVKTLTVSHRDVLFISCIGFAISTVMVTGLIFKLLYWIVMQIYNFLQ